MQFSGFSSRQQEVLHDNLIFKLVELMQDKIMSLYNGQIQFDERTFAKKILKIYKILKKLENGKNQKPNMSESFQELSNLLMQNYKDNTSIGSSILGGQSSILSGFNAHIKDNRSNTFSSNNENRNQKINDLLSNTNLQGSLVNEKDKI
jgi:hypothetical protein